jgi:hypothetical protein
MRPPPSHDWFLSDDKLESVQDGTGYSLLDSHSEPGARFMPSLTDFVVRLAVWLIASAT